MKTLFLTVLLFLMSMASYTYADECYGARWPMANVTVTAMVDGEQFIATYDDRADAVNHAQGLGLCVRNYGVRLNVVDMSQDPKVADKWQEVEGFSVWATRLNLTS